MEITDSFGTATSATSNLRALILFFPRLLSTTFRTLRAFAPTLTITEQRRADHVARVDTRYLPARMGVVYNKGFHLRLETKVGCMLTPFPSRRIVRPYAEV